MPFPFEVPFAAVEADLDAFVDEVFGDLQSEFLALPRGEGFVDYPAFEQAYEVLKRATGGFRDLSPEPVIEAVYRVPLVFIVLRTMLGFTPPEWAYVATQRFDIAITQGAIRSLDRRIRMAPFTSMRANGGTTDRRLRALVATACQLLQEGAPEDSPGVIHRLDKADTRYGVASIQPLADLGVPYAMLLYERFLGRPFAGHRDSVSELVGDVLEAAIEAALTAAGISFRKTKRAERVAGFDQAPDLIIPDEFNPQIVIARRNSRRTFCSRLRTGISSFRQLRWARRRRRRQGLPPRNHWPSSGCSAQPKSLRNLPRASPRRRTKATNAFWI